MNTTVSAMSTVLQSSQVAVAARQEEESDTFGVCSLSGAVEGRLVLVRGGPTLLLLRFRGALLPLAGAAAAVAVCAPFRAAARPAPAGTSTSVCEQAMHRIITCTAYGIPYGMEDKFCATHACSSLERDKLAARVLGALSELM